MNTIRKKRREYQSWKKGYYHLSSDGWQDGKLFYTDQQRAYGMTLMGILTLRFQLIIYDFALMSNHIHILMSGTGAECVRAFDYYKKKISARLVEDSFPPLPHSYFFKLTPIVDEDQMRIDFLYVDRNSLEKGLAVPEGYPWGAAYLHFSPLSKYLRGTPAGAMHIRQIMSLTNSHIPIPAIWEFHPELGLLPGSWIDQTLFRKLFSSPKDYQTRMVKEYEAFVRRGKQLDEKMELSRNELYDIVQHLSNFVFPTKLVKDLSNEEKGRLCILLQEKYDLTSAQIATALSIPEYIVKQLLASKDFGKKKW